MLYPMRMTILNLLKLKNRNKLIQLRFKNMKNQFKIFLILMMEYQIINCCRTKEE